MRIQQRKFTVEYKPSRAQPKPAESIWGDIDLRAVAKQIEDESPALFKNQLSEVRSRERFSEASEAVAATIPEKVLSTSTTENNVATETQATVDSSDVVPPPSVDTVLLPAKPAKISTKRPKKPLSSPVHATTEQDTVTLADIVSLDELAALEAENLMLRGLRLEQLIRENARLKEMIGVVISRALDQGRT